MPRVEPAPGRPEILLIRAPNPGPMTLEGTNTYLVGSGPAWVIDPGPDDPAHLAAIEGAAAARGGIGGVLLTHSHADHTAAVEALGAPLAWGEVGARDELSLEPNATAVAPESDAVREVGPFRVVPTPGHSADHVCFVWRDVCFCGDLVLGRGSSIVLPRAWGGSLSLYLRSLERVRELGCALLAPGHGPWITDPEEKLAEYREHRLDRERALLVALEEGERSRARLLDRVWHDVPAALRPAAALTLEAHLEKLGEEGRLPEDLGP